MISKVKKIGFFSLLILCNNCDTKILQKESMVLEYSDCDRAIVSKASINQLGLFNGNCDYTLNNNTFSTNWAVHKKTNFSFSVISDWKFIDDGSEFLYNSSGKIGNEKAQILFWKKKGRKENLVGLISGTRNALIEKHKNVLLVNESNKNDMYYLEYDIEFTGGKNGHYLELITYKQGYLISVGYYFLTDSFEKHRHVFFNHLSNVFLKKQKLLSVANLLEVMPLNICSVENITEKIISTEKK